MAPCSAIVRRSNDPAHTDYVTASNRGLFLFWFPVGERSALGVKGFFLVQLLNPWPSQLRSFKEGSGSDEKFGRWNAEEIEKMDVAHWPMGCPRSIRMTDYVVRGWIRGRCAWFVLAILSFTNFFPF